MAAQYDPSGRQINGGSDQMSEKEIKLPGFNDFAKLCYQEAEDRGFHSAGKITDLKSPTIVPFVANLHGEVSEFYEAWRAGKLDQPCDKAGKMQEAGLVPLTCGSEECADIIIRAFDTAESLNIDIEEAIKNKLLFNRLRSYRHGNKLA